MCLSTSISFPFQLYDNFLYNASKEVCEEAHVLKFNSTDNFMANKEQQTSEGFCGSYAEENGM